MTKTLSRKQQQARTRERLLRAAERVGAQRGLLTVSLEEIAAEAGYTKGAVYANFAGKEELFLALLEEQFAARVKAIDEVLDSDEPLEEQALEGGRDFLAYVAASPEWERLFFEFAVHATREPAFRVQLVERYRELRSRLAGAIARRLEELGVEDPPVSSEQVALMLFAMANGAALEQLLEPEAVSEDFYGSMLEIFTLGMAVKSGAYVPAQ